MDALTDTELFRWLAALGWLDRIALGVVVIATLRGLWIGLLREAFSIGALAAAFVAVKLWTGPATAWMLERSPWELSLSDRQAHILGGALVGILAAFIVVAVGGFIRKRVHATPLGWLDRLLGGALGSAEGALVVAVALIGVVAFVGQDHEALAGSRSIELLARARVLADELPDVAAPPPAEIAEPGAPDEGGSDREHDWEEAPEGAAPHELEIDFESADEVSV